MRHFLSLLVISLLLLGSSSFGQTMVRTTRVSVEADAGKDAALRTQNEAIKQLFQSGQLDAANTQALKLQQQYEMHFQAGYTPRVFANSHEFESYQRTSKEPVEWIDWGYKQCLHLRAMVAVEKHQYPQALDLLLYQEKMVPYAADAYTEAGFVLNQMQRYEEALAKYQAALRITREFPSQQSLEAMALRGIGFSLIELQKLNEAEAAFHESLRLEPDNQLALSELAYIQQLRRKRQPAAPSY